MDYLQRALAYFNTDKPQWYGWKKEDDNGNKIPNDQRMSYANLIINDSTATMPTETEVNNKIAEIKAEETSKLTDKTNAINKLKGATYSPLTDAESKALFGE